ncbi:Vascular-related protein 2 [Cardamine amara subsp. amara]|uniref:Vascular-related protein 2 n=1 Tax=Cardamine amara subsp. amara TaxID=228776 RepID=A0ABD1B590_CARAN
MENSVNNCVGQRVFSNHQIKTINEEEDQEESSWIIYFEDIDHDDEMLETKEGMSHYYDNDSSMISDAASPVHNTKISRKANNINTNPKKRRIIYQQKEDEEDTASSPSNKTKGFSVLDGAEDNTRNGKSMDNITSEERGCVTDTGSKIGEVMNEEFFSAELKKRGLCVVPLSTLSNFIA